KKVNSTTKSVTHVSGLKCYLCSRFFTFLGGGMVAGKPPSKSPLPKIHSSRKLLKKETLVGAPTLVN
ncbi:hypothetical protein, partial [Leptospira perolatii]